MARLERFQARAALEMSNLSSSI
ncbi:MAG: hypothetical protein QOG67_3253, partial [Verrucomicrobiota bacterium]